VLEIDVPSWTVPSDVAVSITRTGLDLQVKQKGRFPVIDLHRTFLSK
jgi:hypothetical protein